MFVYYALNFTFFKSHFSLTQIYLTFTIKTRSDGSQYSMYSTTLLIADGIALTRCIFPMSLLLTILPFTNILQSTFISHLYEFIKDWNHVNPLSANHIKWSNTLKQFVGCCRWIVWVFDHLVGLALKACVRYF